VLRDRRRARRYHPAITGAVASNSVSHPGSADVVLWGRAGRRDYTPGLDVRAPAPQLAAVAPDFAPLARHVPGLADKRNSLANGDKTRRKYWGLRLA